MPIPQFSVFLLPLLKLAAEGGEHTLQEARNHLADLFAISPEDRSEMLLSGYQRRFDNRVAWAKAHLTRAGVVASPREGVFVITPRGRELPAENPEQLMLNDLDRFEEHRLVRICLADRDAGGAHRRP